MDSIRGGGGGGYGLGGGATSTTRGPGCGGATTHPKTANAAKIGSKRRMVFSPTKVRGRVSAARPRCLYRPGASSESPGRRPEAVPRDKISLSEPPTRPPGGRHPVLAYCHTDRGCLEGRAARYRIAITHRASSPIRFQTEKEQRTGAWRGMMAFWPSLPCQKEPRL
jgi:hypothetical protein